VADTGPGGARHSTPHPLLFDQNEARRAEKKFFGHVGDRSSQRFSKFQPTKEWVNKVNLSSFELENFFKFVLA